jgi:hypothetical protein
MAENSDEDIQEVSKQTHSYVFILIKGLPADESGSCKLQRLKAALWFAVGKMVDEETLRRNRNVTPQFIGALTEMVWAQIGMLLPPVLISISPLK